MRHHHQSHRPPALSDPSSAATWVFAPSTAASIGQPRVPRIHARPALGTGGGAPPNTFVPLGYEVAGLPGHPVDAGPEKAIGSWH